MVSDKELRNAIGNISKKREVVWEDELLLYIVLTKDFVFKDHSALHFVELLKSGLVFLMNEKALQSKLSSMSLREDIDNSVDPSVYRTELKHLL